ncbi:MAG: nuclear transport factor 2 family protein [Bryobacteraceae bacterium]|jgi:predicted SnoaL-like aldol condensation-catalyzing enzyme
MKITRNWHLSLTLALLAGAPAARTAETSQEAANEKLVLDFYNELYKGEAAGNLKDQIARIAEKYMRPDYIQHNPVFGGPGGGRDAFVRAMQQQPSRPPNPNFKPPEIIAVMAERDRVMLFTKRELPDGKDGQPAVAYIFNMFRIHDGKLAEHWDAGAATPPPGGGPPAASVPRSDGAVRRP